MNWYARIWPQILFGYTCLQMMHKQKKIDNINRPTQAQLFRQTVLDLNFPQDTIPAKSTRENHGAWKKNHLTHKFIASNQIKFRHNKLIGRKIFKKNWISTKQRKYETWKIRKQKTILIERTLMSMWNFTWKYLIQKQTFQRKSQHALPIRKIKLFSKTKNSCRKLAISWPISSYFNIN